MYIILIFINFLSITQQSVRAGIFCDDQLKEIYLIDKETGNRKQIAKGTNIDWKTPDIFEDLDAEPGDKIEFICHNNDGFTFGAGCFLINDKCYCYQFDTEKNEYSGIKRPYEGTASFKNDKQCVFEIKYLSEYNKKKDYIYQHLIPLDVEQIECIDNDYISIPKNEEYELKFSDYIKSPFNLKNLKISIDEENYKYFTLNKTELSPGKNFSIESNLTFLHKEHTKIKVKFTSYSIVEEGIKACKLNIRVCYDSCLDCYDKDADNDNHQCKKCKNDYFFIEGTRNCMTKKQIENIGGYYFDENDKKFKKCYIDCFHCTEKGDENDMKCLDCKAPKEYYAEPNNCIEDYENYYYSDEKRKWIKCYETCEGCNATSNEITHNCKECNKDYYFVYNEPGKCISYDEKPLNTYFDTETERFEKCNERRRKMMDQAISQIRPKYSVLLTEYNRLYEHKTRILKDWREKPSLLDTLDSFSDAMCRVTAQIIRYRASYMSRLDEAVKPIHADFSGKGEKIELLYHTVSTVRDPFSSAKEIYYDVCDHQEKHRQAELDSAQCLTGAHKDDVEILINGRSARSFASQGQTRTAALSMKLAEREIILQETGEYPILLLDDVLSELDEKRQEFVLNRIGGGQTLITCCEDTDISGRTGGKVFTVNGGRIRECI